MRDGTIIKHVVFSAQLAAVLEVSGWPKPGNVHRTRDHSDARYEHFLAGSIAIGSSVKDSARRGLMIARGIIDLPKAGIGKLVKKAVTDVLASHNDGNTHLGVCLLFIPLSIAASKTYVENDVLSLDLLRKNVVMIMRSTTPIDAVEVYNAIKIASSPWEMGKVNGGRAPDLYDKRAKKKILDEGITLFDAMLEAASYDTVARELVTGMEASFTIGYNELIETFRRTNNINTAIVHTFLRLLSKFPDTFIARKVGLKKISDLRKAVEIGVKETKWISETANKILNLGGLTTSEGKTLLWELDDKLQIMGKDYSPGTTADLTAASIMIALLSGLKF